MRRNLLAATAAVAVLVLGACNNQTEVAAEQGAPAADQPAAGVDAPAAAETEMPAATTAQGFAMRAALSDMFEIQSSQLALERSQTPQIREFAQRMINEHQSMTNQMQAALQQAGITVTPPTQLDPERAGMVQDLRDTGAGGFDERYIELQMEAHENTLNLFRDYAGNGDNDALKQLANRGAPMIENHLQTVRAIDRAQEAADAPAGGAAAPD